MTDHTPEPWKPAPHYLSILGDPKRDGYDDVVIIADCEVRDAAAPPSDQQEANLARIVACVNACAGIPTEQLQGADLAAVIKHAITHWRNWDGEPEDVAELGAALAPFRETET